MSTLVIDAPIALTSVIFQFIFTRLFHFHLHPVISIHLHPVSVVFAADNNDLLEKKLTCANTTHCTNCIVVQQVPATAKPAAHEQVPKHKAMKNHRSLSGHHTELLPIYNAGARTGPGTYNLALSMIESLNPEVTKQAELRDFAWFLARLPSSSSTVLGATAVQQQIPPWSGFNVILSTSEIPRENRIGFLPVINSSLTELAIVRKVLKSAVAVAKKTAE